MKLAYSHFFKTPYGYFRLEATTKGLYSLDAVKRKPRIVCCEGCIPARVNRLLKKAASKVSAYLAGTKVDFRSLPIDWYGCKVWEKRVLQELRKISWGKVESYQSLAKKAGRPQATRYVGRILHLNRLPLILPCHRVVPKNGGVGGFSRGVRWKRRLLKLEGARVDIQMVA